MTSTNTAWAESLGMSVPLVNAPMGGVAGGRLAAAVSEAGGLGMIGMGSAGTVPALERELAELGDVQRFGIGMIDWVVARDRALLDRALAAGPTLVSVSFGDTWDWVDDVHAAGALAATQVASSDEARRAVEGGVDVIVARGSEGGGHGNPLAPRESVVTDVLTAVEVPVLAAGGIATHQDARAALAAGVAGWWVGTAFTACHEALTPPNAKSALIAARSTDTVTTRVFDQALGLPWPERFPARVLTNSFTRRWSRPRDDGPALTDESVRAVVETAMVEDDPMVAPVDAGEGVGFLRSRESAATVVARLTGELPPRMRWR